MPDQANTLEWTALLPKLFLQAYLCTNHFYMDALPNIFFALSLCLDILFRFHNLNSASIKLI